MVVGGSGEELCGLLYGDELEAIDNVAPDCCAEYAMDWAQQEAVMRTRGWPDAIWHTHPGGTRFPSSLDLATHPAGINMVIATSGWIGTWLDGRQVQEAWRVSTSNDTGEVFQNKDDSWSWHVQAANGKVVDEGHGFNDKASAAAGLYRARPDLQPEDVTPGAASEADAVASGTPAGLDAASPGAATTGPATTPGGLMPGEGAP